MLSEDFEQEVVDGLEAQMIGEKNRPTVEGWSEDEDYSDWVATHGDQIRTIICNTPEFRDSPFCGPGLH
ncbi:MAG: hypothetical protein HY914_01260 [Desulfomonile tiedjei]|nr:hypothetical protein [Desulfomonile tiedjei]